MRLLTFIFLLVGGSFISIKSVAKPAKVNFKKGCGEWKNYYNADGKIGYRERQCDGYTQRHTFR